MTKLFQKGFFPSKTNINEHHHSILHIQISLVTKFQLELTILSFWTKFARKECLWSKTKKKNNKKNKQKKIHHGLIYEPVDY